jgi:tetratricopeptide (TPR) repeat protein
LAAVLLGIALVFLVRSGGQPRPTTLAQKRGVVRSRSHGKRPHAATTTTTASPGSTTAAPASTSPGSQSPAATGTQVGSTAPAQSADQLNNAGYQLMQRGDYSRAIPLLQRALALAPHNNNSLTYAYALYNLGASYLGAGEPRKAIPILRARLLIPNQTAVVQAELAKAEQAAGIAQSSSGGGPPSGGHGRDHGHNGQGNGQGEG